MRPPGGRVRALVVNPVVRTLLRSPAHRLLSGSLLLLDDTGRRSGRRYVLPVAYAAAGDDLVVVVGQPASKTWWRNFDGAPQEPLVHLARTRCAGDRSVPPERRHRGRPRRPATSLAWIVHDHRDNWAVRDTGAPSTMPPLTP